VAIRPTAMVIVSLALAIATSANAASLPRYRPVFRVDGVSASIQDRKLVVHADGAVSSGGWRHPRLIIKPSAQEASVLEMDFVADPPQPNHVFVQELLPIGADLSTDLPKAGTLAVSVASQTNEVTAQIRR